MLWTEMEHNFIDISDSLKRCSNCELIIGEVFLPTGMQFECFDLSSLGHDFKPVSDTLYECSNCGLEKCVNKISKDVDISWIKSVFLIKDSSGHYIDSFAIPPSCKNVRMQKALK